MQVKFIHLGYVRTSADPIMGYYTHKYLCEAIESGIIEEIYDDDYLPDGVYEVAEDFFEKYCSILVEDTEEW